MTQKRGGITFFLHAGSLILSCQILAWNGLKLQRISNVNWKLPLEATIQIFFYMQCFIFNSAAKCATLKGKECIYFAKENDSATDSKETN